MRARPYRALHKVDAGHAPSTLHNMMISFETCQLERFPFLSLTAGAANWGAHGVGVACLAGGAADVDRTRLLA